VEEVKGNKEKEKGKEMRKEKIFSLTRKIKILKPRIPGLKSWMRKSFGKIPDTSRNQVSRNDPK